VAIGSLNEWIECNQPWMRSLCHDAALQEGSGMVTSDHVIISDTQLQCYGDGQYQLSMWRKDCPRW
jgi:hypothetical protein